MSVEIVGRYKPRDGSLPYRVIEFFRDAPDEELTASDIAEKFGVKVNTVASSLAQAVDEGALRRQMNRDHLGVYCAGELARPNAAGGLVHWPRHGAAPDATDETKAPAKKPPAAGSGRSRLPRLDASALVVRHGVPLPDTQSIKGRSRYAATFALLKRAGDSVLVPIAYKGAISKAAFVHSKNTGRNLVVRAAEVPGMCGVWLEPTPNAKAGIAA